MIYGRYFFHQPIKNDIKHMITLERLQLLKEMITQLDVYWTIPILKKYYQLIAIDLNK